MRVWTDVGSEDGTDSNRESADNSAEVTVTFYRPTGEKELSLIRGSGWLAFPPRLPGQPIFYPVLNEDYATQIARDWNTKDPVSRYSRHVLRFRVRRSFRERYEVHRVSGRGHDEYWIPADDLDNSTRTSSARSS